MKKADTLDLSVMNDPVFTLVVTIGFNRPVFNIGFVWKLLFWRGKYDLTNSAYTWYYYIFFKPQILHIGTTC